MTSKKTALREWQVSWYLVIVLVIVLAGVFIAGMVINQRQRTRLAEQEATLQMALSRREEQQLSLQQKIDNIGSKSYIETRARADYAYLKPGELRFEVVNSDQLDNYTDEEWQVILDEMAMP